ncbi:hypothetical protein Q7P37_011347 [Cladosporium fusiforme]
MDESFFPKEGGFIEGRFCAPISVLPGNPSCCLPCPATDWAYADAFNTYNDIGEWLNVVGLVLLVFMLLSYVVLPTQKTRSHYLSVCLIIAVIMICLGFVVPLGANPRQCYDEITPNDMYSSMGCAWSGAFIVAGGLCAASWICIRALSMNLQICWDIVPGRRFFYISQAVGWGIPAVLFTVTMTITGVSFRFGSACHVNHANSMADFWGPLMGIAGIAGILQLMTFAYCMHVYLKNLWVDSPANSTNASGSGLPSYTGSIHTQTARAVYQRLKKVLWLQWRGIVIVSIILVDVIFFAIVFVYLDGLQASVPEDIDKVMPWLMCLAQNPQDKEKCLDKAQAYLVNEHTVIAVLMLLSLAGIQVFLFLTRPSIFPAWIEFFRHRFTSRQEFVSLDARNDAQHGPSKQEYHNFDRSYMNTTFEMQKPGYSATISGPLTVDPDRKSPSAFDSPHDMISSPDEAYHGHFRTGSTIPPGYSERMSPDPSYDQPSNSRLAHHDSTGSMNPILRHQNSSSRDIDYSDPHSYSTSPPPVAATGGERRYNPPTASFSAPKTPSRQSSFNQSHGASGSYDARDRRARGGLGFHPPEEEEDQYWGRRF